MPQQILDVAVVVEYAPSLTSVRSVAATLELNASGISNGNFSMRSIRCLPIRTESPHL